MASGGSEMKKQREACWKARDLLWQCLDKHHDEGSSHPKCSIERADYEKSCPALWIKHFDERRRFELFKRKEQEAEKRKVETQQKADTK